MNKNLKRFLLTSACAAGLSVSAASGALAQNLIVAPAEGGAYASVQGQFMFWEHENDQWIESSDGADEVDNNAIGGAGAVKLGWAAPSTDPDIGNWDFAIQGGAGFLSADDTAERVASDTPSWAYADCTDSTDQAGGRCSMEDEIAYYFGDLEVGYSVGHAVGMEENSAVRVFGGVRGAYIDFSRGNDEILHSDEGANFSDESTFWGGGPRVGVAFRTPLGSNRNIQLIGGVAGAALFGEVDSDTVLHSVEDDTVTKASDSEFQIVYNAEGELGLSVMMDEGARLDVGYRAEVWVDAYRIRSELDDNNDSDDAESADYEDGGFLSHGPFIRAVFEFGGPEPMMAPPPEPAPIPRQFIIFFDWDVDELSAEAQAIVADAAGYVLSGGIAQVVVTGHTDTSGSQSYNVGLSKRRADNTAGALAANGVDPATIAVNWKGETEPLVATGDGVREPQNRRAEIVFP